MVLVDTSVWIDIFRASVALDLESLVDFDEVVTCLPIVQEVLQGFDDERAFRLARESMTALPMVESPMVEGLFLEAADLYRSARRLGLTVRSGVDCLIATCALRNDLTVLHRDRDFETISRVVPLRVRRVMTPKP
jgi:predicted nucleic acid-binding protein